MDTFCNFNFSHGNAGCGVFKGGIQNKKDFCMKEIADFGDLD